jgi:anti-sigma B factor antagonist
MISVLLNYERLKGIEGDLSLLIRSGSFKVRLHFLTPTRSASMAFTINTRKVQDVVIVDMSGQLSAGEPVLLLRNTVRHFIDDGSRKFLLNLGKVSYIDSSGLGELIVTYTSLRNRQGDVKLLNLTKLAKDLLQMTKLLTVFDTFDDEAKAVQSFASPATA